ncbi:MAG: hypothetical protein AAGI28_12155 [Pseudomonadota bacterium]
MSLAAALLIVAQGAAPQVAETPVTRARPVAVYARASVRIIRPVSVDFAVFEEVNQQTLVASEPEIQRSRDVDGTPWVEFS